MRQHIFSPALTLTTPIVMMSLITLIIPICSRVDPPCQGERRAGPWTHFSQLLAHRGLLYCYSGGSVLRLVCGMSLMRAIRAS